MHNADWTLPLNPPKIRNTYTIVQTLTIDSYMGVSDHPGGGIPYFGVLIIRVPYFRKPLYRTLGRPELELPRCMNPGVRGSSVSIKLTNVSDVHSARLRCSSFGG